MAKAFQTSFRTRVEEYGQLLSADCSSSDTYPEQSQLPMEQSEASYPDLIPYSLRSLCWDEDPIKHTSSPRRQVIHIIPTAVGKLVQRRKQALTLRMLHVWSIARHHCVAFFPS
jgi:hypothetical protein